MPYDNSSRRYSAHQQGRREDLKQWLIGLPFLFIAAVIFTSVMFVLAVVTSLMI